MLKLFLPKFFPEQKYQNIIQQVPGTADLPDPFVEPVQATCKSTGPRQQVGADKAGLIHPRLCLRMPADVIELGPRST